ncbi:hypothetical protein LHP98_06315 [Rhodobacter sp. Har01]|uniref:I78 family peptidase inhibitor n=1 Tax=Rhodobacter sp. Har01 TaxID=2883999 RepID=UPI001D060AE0|nr:I78 family peptidase inhibitor [Rhodobacter sp. Har01]MCB6177743.1 hypothetical protein [Rhodobacter sp. Har01]
MISPLRPLVLCAALVPLILAACVTEMPGPPDPMEQSCGAEGLQGLVGQYRGVLAAMTFKGPVRVIEPGMAVTMDYSPSRLNIELDAAGRITRVYCG